VDAGTIAQIAIGKRHSWLKTKFPIEYESMLLRPTSRTSISNSAEARGINYPLVVSTEGIVYEVVHLRNFAKEHSLDSGSLSRLLNRKAKSHKGWKLAEGELP
jgi:hypothetical protein